MIDGYQKFIIDPRIETMDLKDYIPVDVILTLLENLYKGATNSDSFVFNLISQNG